MSGVGRGPECGTRPKQTDRGLRKRLALYSFLFNDLFHDCVVHFGSFITHPGNLRCDGGPVHESPSVVKKSCPRGETLRRIEGDLAIVGKEQQGIGGDLRFPQPSLPKPRPDA